MSEDDEDMAIIFRRRRLLCVAFGCFVLERNENFRIAAPNEEKLDLWNSTHRWNQCLGAIDKLHFYYHKSMKSRRNVRIAVAFRLFYLVAKGMRTYKRWNLKQHSLKKHLRSRIITISMRLPADCFDAVGDPLYNNLIDLATDIHRQRQQKQAKLFIQRLKRRVDRKQLVSRKLAYKCAPAVKIFFSKVQGLTEQSRQSSITTRHCKQHNHRTTRLKLVTHWHRFMFSSQQKRMLSALSYEHCQERLKKLVFYTLTQRLDHRAYNNRINHPCMHHYQTFIERKLLTRWRGKCTDHILTSGIEQKAHSFHRKYRLRHAIELLSRHCGYSTKQKEQHVYVESIMKRLRRFFILRRGLHTWQLNHHSLYSQRWYDRIAVKHSKKVVYRRLVHGRLLQQYLPIVLRRQAALMRRAAFHHFITNSTKALSTWQASFIQSQSQVDSCIKATWQWKLYRARRAFTRIQQYTLRRIHLRERNRKKLVFLYRNTDEKVLLESFYHWRAVYDRLVSVRRERIRKEFLLGRDNALDMLRQPQQQQLRQVPVTVHHQSVPSDNDLLHMAPKPLTITYPKIPDYLKYSTTTAMLQVDSALALSEWRKEQVVDEYLAKAASAGGVGGMQPRGSAGQDQEKIDFVHMKPRLPSAFPVYHSIEEKKSAREEEEEQQRVLKEALQFLRALQTQLVAETSNE